MSNLVYFFGRFHVLALHLPIGIIAVAVALQWVVRKPRYAQLASAMPFLWGAAAAASILTVILGYLHFAEGGLSGPSATAHRFYGTTVAVVATLIWLACARWTTLYRRFGLAAGVLLAVLVTITGHYGGNLTHGSTYLLQYAPGPLRALAGMESARPRVTSLAMADPYLDVVRPMLQARCATCHNADKRNSGFSVASYDSTLVGGETGRAIVPGQPAMSELYRRINLPADDEEFMPAEGKTPLTAKQVELLRWWIEAGAPANTTLGAVGVAPEIEPLLAAELGLAPSLDNGTSGATAAVSADPAVVKALYEAGFLVRQVSQSDPRLIVSVYSPGAPLRPEQLAALISAADRIVELNLQGAGVADAELAQFERFTALARLRLSDNEVTDAGLVSLAKLPKLTSLILYGNRGVTDAGLDSLAGMAALSQLYLWQTGVSAQGVARLLERRPGIRVQLGTAEVLSAATEAAIENAKGN